MNILQNILFGFTTGFLGCFLYKEIEFSNLSSNEDTAFYSDSNTKVLNNSDHSLDMIKDETFASQGDIYDNETTDNPVFYEKIDHPDIKNI